jgi:O-antigen/teichoic acid export membrane protein
VVERQVGCVSASVRRNAFHGLVGFALPTVVLLASYPVLVRHLGAAALGVYLLAGSISGATLLLDLGFSAATLKFVAEDLAAARPRSAADVIVTSLAYYGLLGAVGGSVVAILAPWVVAMLKIDTRLAADAVWVFRLAGLQLAAFLPATVFVAIAKGMQQFDRSMLTVSFLSIATYGGAIVAVLAGGGLPGAMVASVLANVATLALAAFQGIALCRKHGVGLRAGRPRWEAMRRMFGFSWVMTVNSLSGFLLYQIQKYVLGAAMGPAAVTIYQTAALGPSKVHAAVNAATEVMFPLASAARDRAELRRVYLKMLGASAIVASAAFGLLIGIARPALRLWLGTSLAASAAPLLPVFALAYLFLALSPAPFHLLNGLGRPGLNTAFCALNALVNVTLIAVFTWSGITLEKLAWAFATANIVTSVTYQAAVEVLIWRPRPQLKQAVA